MGKQEVGDSALKCKCMHYYIQGALTGFAEVAEKDLIKLAAQGCGLTLYNKLHT